MMKTTPTLKQALNGPTGYNVEHSLQTMIAMEPTIGQEDDLEQECMVYQLKRQSMSEPALYVCWLIFS
ncbi:unnamed protein product [Ambrosiozyma monospora]|uniref:Unnamed protein product n=1 Tax=Ambrosiozyma monospora TaxID=43982 RepID=A0A9W6YSX3_AMBMO|nr:unnamed protein product [Ambrosiozyma monospora]